MFGFLYPRVLDVFLSVVCGHCILSCKFTSKGTFYAFIICNKHNFVMKFRHYI